MKGRVLILGVFLSLAAFACAGAAGPQNGDDEVVGSEGVSTSETGDATTSTSDPEMPATAETGTSSTTAGSEGGEVPADEEAPPATSVPADGKPEGSDTTVIEPGNIDSSLQPFVDMAIADLAGRLGISESEVTALSATLVVWPDTSLGCPQPDMVYAQVPQDGSLIELGAAGKVFRYHTGGNQYTPFLCDQPLAERPPTGDSEL